ncbi:exodeoxyribonuclease 7 large subunit [bacterium BMS3Abin04]|nr:exodeoxyribonuclease 7 large subunit [bacterium BMS3Abin04]
MNDIILTVGELTSQIKMLLEEEFDSFKIVGEISNFKAHVSGHWYFTLKDSNAQISCTMWRGVNNYVFFTPQDGMKVVIKGKLTVYPPRGSYQINVRSMQPAGEGELQAAFERLKKKLRAEGLFDEENKKAIPNFPQKIGIVTGVGTAALRDMISVAKRRYPLFELVVAGAAVQGEVAAGEIVSAIRQLNKRKDIDLIIVARGGGSLEDLWPFNEEIVARAIFESKIPTISGVGHEIDFTIADFVADLRAPTPSAAMELATPNKDEIFAFVNDFSYNIKLNILDKIKNHKSSIYSVVNAYGFRNPLSRINYKVQFLDNLVYRISNNIEVELSASKSNLAFYTKSIEAHNLEATLKRGFSLIKQNGKYIKRAKNLIENKSFTIQFYDNEKLIESNE